MDINNLFLVQCKSLFFSSQDVISTFLVLILCLCFRTPAEQRVIETGPDGQDPQKQEWFTKYFSFWGPTEHLAVSVPTYWEQDHQSLLFCIITQLQAKHQISFSTGHISLLSCLTKCSTQTQCLKLLQK